MKKIISMSIAFATIIIVAVIVFDKFDVIRKCFIENKVYFFLIALIYIAGRLLDGSKLKILVSYCGADIKLYECFGLSMIMPLYNLIFPNAGLISNALYLKSRHSVKLRHFASVSLLRFVTTTALCCIMGIVASIVFMVEKKNIILLWPVTIYVLLLGISVCLFVLPLPKIDIFRKYKLFSKVSESISKFDEIKSDKRLIALLVLIQIAISLVFMSRYYIVLKALSFDAPLIGMLAITPLTVLSNLINIIPANLAIREAVVSGGLTLIGYTINDGLLVASIDRVVLLATILVIGTWFLIRFKYSASLVMGIKMSKESRVND